MVKIETYIKLGDRDKHKLNQSMRKIKRDQCGVFYVQILETVSSEDCIRHCDSFMLHST